MGGGLLVLLASLWMRDVIPDTPTFFSLSTYRLDAIRAAFGLGLLMSVIGHLNLIIPITNLTSILLLNLPLLFGTTNFSGLGQFACGRLHFIRW